MSNPLIQSVAVLNIPINGKIELFQYTGYPDTAFTLICSDGTPSTRFIWDMANSIRSIIDINDDNCKGIEDFLVDYPQTRYKLIPLIHLMRIINSVKNDQSHPPPDEEKEEEEEHQQDDAKSRDDIDHYISDNSRGDDEDEEEEEPMDDMDANEENETKDTQEEDDEEDVVVHSPSIIPVPPAVRTIFNYIGCVMGKDGHQITDAEQKACGITITPHEHCDQDDDDDDGDLDFTQSSRDKKHDEKKHSDDDDSDEDDEDESGDEEEEDGRARKRSRVTRSQSRSKRRKRRKHKKKRKSKRRRSSRPQLTRSNSALEHWNDIALWHDSSASPSSSQEPQDEAMSVSFDVPDEQEEKEEEQSADEHSTDACTATKRLRKLDQMLTKDVFFADEDAMRPGRPNVIIAWNGDALPENNIITRSSTANKVDTSVDFAANKHLLLEKGDPHPYIFRFYTGPDTPDQLAVGLIINIFMKASDKQPDPPLTKVPAGKRKRQTTEGEYSREQDFKEHTFSQDECSLLVQWFKMEQKICWSDTKTEDKPHCSFATEIDAKGVIAPCHYFTDDELSQLVPEYIEAIKIQRMSLVHSGIPTKSDAVRFFFADGHHLGRTIFGRFIRDKLMFEYAHFGERINKNLMRFIARSPHHNISRIRPSHKGSCDACGSKRNLSYSLASYAFGSTCKKKVMKAINISRSVCAFRVAKITDNEINAFIRGVTDPEDRIIRRRPSFSSR